MREDGFEAMAVVSHAALLGTSENIHPCTNIDELVAGFDLAKLSRAPARFDEKELAALNAKLLHMTPWSAVSDRLPGHTETFWNAVRGNVEKLSDTIGWSEILTHHGKFGTGADEDFLAKARAVLPPEPWDTNTWKNWTESVKAATGRRGKELYMPLRLALTGLDHGPELAALLPLIGRQKVLERMR
jgi:glutamyl-tRNA synthetase